jgi:TIR domain
VVRRHRRERSRVGNFDVFVSYSQKDPKAADGFVAALHKRRPNTEIFVDRLEIDHGAAWQREVFESLERCQTVVCMLTPSYLASQICLEEFNIAWMRSREDHAVALRPLFVADVELPT